ncbi:glycine receptor subunit alphaZ1-like [Watersipora subatra]|uniref:glycine receptor subunit alphaZ1-like n=1 Tax=Watersipora subatra TaxID=2589382 RepID=UPI00355C3835
MLEKTHYGYQFKSGTKINHLFYMYDIKLYANKERDIDSLMYTVFGIRLLLLIIYASKRIVHGNDDKNALLDSLNELFEGYDKASRPPDDDSTAVGVDVYVISLSAISEKNMDYTANMYLRQRWKDVRLANPNLTSSNGVLITNRLNDIWVPDLFIKNDKTSEKSEVTTLNAFLRLDGDGQLIYSLRVTATVACSMHLSKYPFDVQYCDMFLESYGHLTEELKFYWNNRSAQAVEINEKIQLPEHIIGKTMLRDCTESYNTTGSFSCISAQFEFKRNINYYMMGLFLPSILIVILSWVSFWIDKASTPGRVSLALLTILTMQNQMSSTLSQLPKVSYIKLVDVWLTVCLGFVFTGFLEYALVNKLATQEKEKQNKFSVSQGLKTTLPANHLNPQKKPEESSESCSSETFMKPSQASSLKEMQLSDKVDYHSRWIFPLTFTIFNVIIWLYYFLSKDTI